MAAPTLFFNKDVGVVLQFTLKKPDGNPRDVTGDTVELLVEGIGAGSATTTFSMTIVDGANGIVKRTIAANDFPIGTYRAQVRDTTAGSNKFHSEIFRIQVSEALV